jgi:hypothetical protein
VKKTSILSVAVKSYLGRIEELMQAPARNTPAAEEWDSVRKTENTKLCIPPSLKHSMKYEV